MGKYDEYFLMNADQAAEYAIAKIPEIEWDAATTTPAVVAQAQEAVEKRSATET